MCSKGEECKGGSVCCNGEVCACDRVCTYTHRHTHTHNLATVEDSLTQQPHLHLLVVLQAEELVGAHVRPAEHALHPGLGEDIAQEKQISRAGKYPGENK